MYKDIKQPLNFAVDLAGVINDVKTLGNVLRISIGQDPTLTEMYDTIIWAANTFTPTEVEFTIDPTFAGEREYLQVYQYLTNRGFEVKSPQKKKVVNVEPFNPDNFEIPPIITGKVESEQTQTDYPVEGAIGISAYPYRKQVDLTTAIFGAVALAAVSTTLTLLFTRSK